MKSQKLKNFNEIIILSATLILGFDYIVGFIFKGVEGLSFNRFIFVVLIFFSFIHNSKIYIATIKRFSLLLYCILLSVVPYILGAQNHIDEILNIFGIVSYLLFFYVNVRYFGFEKKILIILFISSVVLAGYLLLSYFGIVGIKMTTWRFGLEVNRLSGISDPNITILYLLPLFSFGPILVFQKMASIGVFIRMIVIPLFIFIGVFVTIQTYSRAGFIAAMLSVFVSTFVCIFLSRKNKLFSREDFYLTVVISCLAIFAQMKYSLFSNVYYAISKTEIMTDTSFMARMASYKFLLREISSPSFWGTGYSYYWRETGWVGYFPHCLFVDIYIKGGMVFLLIYVYIYINAIFSFLHQILNPSLYGIDRVIGAGFLGYLVGFFPLAITLSIDRMKMPWAIIGCGLGIALKNARVKHVVRRKLVLHSCDGSSYGRIDSFGSDK